MKPNAQMAGAKQSRSFRERSRIVALTLACGLMNDSSAAQATVYCEDINGDRTMVGEARYALIPGQGCYANIYWDGGDELSLDQGETVGGASTSATNLGFYVTTDTRDPFSDACADLTYTLVHKRSNTVSANCPSSFMSSTSTLIVSSCDFGDDDDYYVDKRFGTDSFSFNQYWQWDLTVSASSQQLNCTASDSGCARVSSTCTRKNY